MTELRLGYIEKRLAEGARDRVVVQELRNKFGIHRCTAARYVSLCLARLAAEAGIDDRAEWKQRLEHLALETFEQARSRRGMQLDKEGREHFFANPDASAMASVLRVLGALKGVGGEGRGNVNVQINNTHNTLVGDEAAKALARFYTGAPARALDATATTAAPAQLAAQNGAQALEHASTHEQVPR
jgi:hypothetical protein